MRTNPDRGEIWLVDLTPTRGAEISKTRPALVMSSLSIGRLSLRIIVPMTKWSPEYEAFPWMTSVNPNESNGLSKPSAADAFQIRSVSTRRFVKRLGVLPQDVVSNIAKAIAICIDLDL
ncbi:MAG: type II toxin-antitoxin system PemK/MazF family toxin [Candidatus Coatesbacteria bacterium]|nr:type II toxin-antitoxin system PemK/MazF family toxin [Candidatus Coatesbacteria bacterium]